MNFQLPSLVCKFDFTQQITLFLSLLLHLSGILEALGYDTTVSRKWVSTIHDITKRKERNTISVLKRSLLLQLKALELHGQATLMESACPKESSSVSSSPYSSPNVRALLKIKILSWSHETGFPLSVRVRVSNRIFNIHKFPLFSKSGYFKRRMKEEELESTEIVMGPDFPGGPDTFEMILLFVYGSTTLIDPFNVAVLRCAAEFLEMTEENSPNNLCDRFDRYMNQVVLQNWDDTLIVLQKCQSLLPLAEELLIVSRCIESLAFMACMEILDPERRRDHPVVTSHALSSDHRPWSSDQVKEILRQELWIKDLIALPFDFFKRIIGSLRRQGMKEKYVSPLIVFYATKCLFSKKTDQKLLQGILDLLTLGDKASKLIPVGFYLALLSKSLEVGLRCDKLRDQIVLMLHRVDLRDVMSSGIDLGTMERIVCMYVCSSDMGDASHVACAVSNNAAVGELWDGYLCSVAVDSEMESDRFVKLIEMVPMAYRHSHDNLYKAVNAFLQVHRDLTLEEKIAICKYLSCQKLSHEICVDAVQNDLMPLRLIVQALFVQQLHTQQAFKECSESFRYTHSSPSKSTPYTQPLGFLLQKDKNTTPDDEYQDTNFRIQSLQQELLSLKRSLRWKKAAEKGGGELECRQKLGCIGFGSRRKYVSRILKVLRRITLSDERKSGSRRSNMAYI